VALAGAAAAEDEGAGAAASWLLPPQLARVRAAATATVILATLYMPRTLLVGDAGQYGQILSGLDHSEPLRRPGQRHVQVVESPR
jgi:hypothetical protein